MIHALIIGLVTVGAIQLGITWIVAIGLWLQAPRKRRLPPQVTRKALPSIQVEPYLPTRQSKREYDAWRALRSIGDRYK